jgi:hypothetical protein
MEVVNIVTKGEEMNKEKAGETLGCGVGCLAYIVLSAIGVLFSALPIVVGIWIYNMLFN